MQIEFTKEHTINKTYKKGDTENVNDELAEKLINEKVAKQATKKKPKGD